MIIDQTYITHWMSLTLKKMYVSTQLNFNLNLIKMHHDIKIWEVWKHLWLKRMKRNPCKPKKKKNQNQNCNFISHNAKGVRNIHVQVKRAWMVLDYCATLGNHSMKKILDSWLAHLLAWSACVDAIINVNEFEEIIPSLCLVNFDAT